MANEPCDGAVEVMLMAITVYKQPNKVIIILAAVDEPFVGI